MLDEMLSRLSNSINIVGIAHAFSPNCILIVVPSLKRTVPSQSIQIITSIEMLDEM